MTDLLTPDEAATILRVNRETILRWLRDGHMRGIKLPGDRGIWRIERREIERVTMSGEYGGE